MEILPQSLPQHMPQYSHITLSTQVQQTTHLEPLDAVEPGLVPRPSWHQPFAVRPGLVAVATQQLDGPALLVAVVTTQRLDELVRPVAVEQRPVEPFVVPRTLS